MVTSVNAMSAITLSNNASSAISSEALQLARDLAKEFDNCMWWRHPNATVETREDAYLIVQHLREYGGHRGWREAQRLWKCL